MSVTMEKELAITTEEAAKYLTLYVGEDKDWGGRIASLYRTNIDKYKRTESQAKENVRNSIAFAVMGPELLGVPVPDQPYELLLRGLTFHQFQEKDNWPELLRKRIEQDKQIEIWRNQCLSLGVVYPIEYSPVTRQAFNWLFDKATEAGAVNDQNRKDMSRRYENLVMAYGGNVICEVFKKEEYKIKKKVLNWRTNYFFERLIFETFGFEYVFATKKKELLKTNQKLVKSVRTD